ncbi:MAG: type II toxin-antitoxin system VapC family toxin [Candidatus Eremiobacterota bacterium]
MKENIKSIFMDTAPIIYYIEGNSQFYQIKELINQIQENNITIFSSVITITEVLVKPVSLGQMNVINSFLNFLKNPDNIIILSVNERIAEQAGYLRGKYPSLKTLDAIQISSAIEARTDAFLTNDLRLKQIKEIEVLTLKDMI